jgi:hypothetical protein
VVGIAKGKDWKVPIHFVRSNDLDKGKPVARRGRKARGLDESPDSPAAERSVLMGVLALPQLMPVPILSGSNYFLHSAAQAREFEVPQSDSVVDEKEVR